MDDGLGLIFGFVRNHRIAFLTDRERVILNLMVSTRLFLTPPD